LIPDWYCYICYIAIAIQACQKVDPFYLPIFTMVIKALPIVKTKKV